MALIDVKSKYGSCSENCTILIKFNNKFNIGILVQTPWICILIVSNINI
jgi:hypothetical protein